MGRKGVRTVRAIEVNEQRDCGIHKLVLVDDEGSVWLTSPGGWDVLSWAAFWLLSGARARVAFSALGKRVFAVRIAQRYLDRQSVTTEPRVVTQVHKSEVRQ